VDRAVASAAGRTALQSHIPGHEAQALERGSSKIVERPGVELDVGNAIGHCELDDVLEKTAPDATAPVLRTDAYLVDLIPASLEAEDVLDPMPLHRESVSHRNVPDVSDPDLRIAGCQPVSKPSLEARPIEGLEDIRTLADVQLVNIGAQRGQDGLITERS